MNQTIKTAPSHWPQSLLGNKMCDVQYVCVCVCVRVVVLYIFAMHQLRV